MGNEKLNNRSKGRVRFVTLKMLLFLFFIGISVLLLGAIYQTKEQDKREEKQYQELRRDRQKRGVRKLHKKYKDMIGWVEIDDSDFSYPIMQTKSDPEYYLHKDVNGNYSFCGTPFLDSRCSEQSDNMIIYGHNINGRRYFGFLQNYREQSFYESHPEIYFTKVNDIRSKYEIVSVIKTDTSLDYYKFTDSYNDEEYRKYVQEIVDTSLYPCVRADALKKEMKEDTVKAFFHKYQFLTLSTCRTGEGENARLLIVACRKISNKKEEHTK